MAIMAEGVMRYCARKVGYAAGWGCGCKLHHLGLPWVRASLIYHPQGLMHLRRKGFSNVPFFEEEMDESLKKVLVSVGIPGVVAAARAALARSASFAAAILLR